jgi:hypothetical protein
MARVRTLEEAAKKSTLSTKTIQRYLQSGRLKGVKIDGRWMIDLPDDLELAQGQKEQATDNSDVSELDSLRTEVQWLRRHADELTIANLEANRELALVSSALIVALQDISKLNVSLASLAAGQQKPQAATVEENLPEEEATDGYHSIDDPREHYMSDRDTHAYSAA